VARGRPFVVVTDIPFLDLARADADCRSELSAAASEVIRSGWYVLGPQVEAFESEFAAYVGAKHCVGVGNGLDAMTLCLRAWGIGPGHEVVVPSNTYIATWLAVTQCGATLVPVEPSEASFTIDADVVARVLTGRTGALLPVHLYGRPADLLSIRALATDAGIRLLDDAAQAHGAECGGRRVGGLTDATAWSFYPTKNLGALGDGGAVTTDDDETAATLRQLRNYGTSSKYVNARQGVNSRLDEMQAAILRVKLRHLDDWIDRRSRIADAYTAALADSGLRLPGKPADGRHAWHLYVVRHPRRDELQRELAARGIGTLIHYPIPPHLQGAYASLGAGPGAFPVSEAIHREVLSLPLAPYLTAPEVDAVIDATIASCRALS
jgi:dTDP-4-amino-4,6-dideoxygalactose transaminase